VFAHKFEFKSFCWFLSKHATAPVRLLEKDPGLRRGKLPGTDVLKYAVNVVNMVVRGYAPAAFACAGGQVRE
jgi:hypothetical protein